MEYTHVTRCSSDMKPVLQEREVVRVGSRKPIQIDVRLAASTNVDLPEAVAAGRFRADPYYRLNVVTLSLPPLRDRPADVLPLTQHFLDVYGRRLNVEPPPDLHRLEELTIRRAFLFCGRNQVHTARLLGMSRNVLRKLLKRFDLIGTRRALADFDELEDDLRQTVN